MESKHKGGVMGIFKCKNAEVHMEQGPIGRTLLMFAAPRFFNRCTALQTV